MNVLVTGGTGFIGMYLVPALLESGHNVRLLVRDKRKAERMYGNKCEIIVGDIADKESLVDCCDDIDVVYHMAALMGHDMPSPKSFEKFRKVNVEGVKNLVDEAKKVSIKKFIFISSTAALGLQDVVVVDEQTKCKPYTPYQVSKREGELLLLNEIEKNNFPAIILRPSMIYGPGFKGDFLTIAKVCKYGIFPKIGLGKNLSPALYITDLVEILIMFIEKGKTGEMYMISSRKSYTLRETVVIISGALNKKIFFIYCPKIIAVMGAKLLEVICNLLKKKPIVTARNIRSISQDRIVDISKLYNEMEYIPQIELNEGLKKTVAYYIEEKYI